MNENEKMSSDKLNFDFDDYEKKLEEDLAKDFSDLKILNDDRDKISNPEALSEVVLKEIWNQFGNQIGLDMTNETLIQKYDREHPETYEEVGKKVMRDERYKAANKEMKSKQAEGQLYDEYTGKKISADEKANLDHTVSRKEIYENQRRRQAGIPTEDLANKKENLNATNEALNKSKGAKSVDKMINTREQREADIKAQNERANKKIDESNKSEVDKKLEKEKNNKKMQDKLDANDELMKKKDEVARKAINKDIVKGVVKETGKKAGMDALKTMAVQALFDLLKEVMNALVRFFKQASKTFNGFLDEMKKALKRFFDKIMSFLQSGAMTAVGTIVSEIFGPIVSTFQKLASLIKQGFRSLGEAITYLTDSKNRNKSFNVKIAEVSKIIVSGLAVAGAIFSGDLFEKLLISAFPALGAIQIPLLGSLANIIGMFLASMIIGVIGAIVLNLIDKAIAKQQLLDNTYSQIDKKNEIINTQLNLLTVTEMKVDKKMSDVESNIKDRHEAAADIMRKSIENSRLANERAIASLDELDELFK